MGQRVRLQKHRYDKEEHQCADHRAKHTQQDAQAPPSLPVRIIKNGFCHCWMCTNYRKRQAEAGQSGIALSCLSSCTTWECAITLGILLHDQTYCTGAAQLAVLPAADNRRAGLTALLCFWFSSRCRRHLDLW